MTNGSLTQNGHFKDDRKGSFLNRIRQDIQPTLRDYLRIFFRRKYFVFIPALISLLGAFVYSYTIRDRFQAQTIVMIEDKKLLKLAMKRLTFESALEDKLNMIKTEMLSWNNLYSVIQELGMDVEERATTDPGMEHLIRKLQGSTSIDLSGFSGGIAVLQMSCVGSNPTTVTNFINSLRDRYIEKQLQRQDRDTNEAIKYIQQESENYKKKVKKNDTVAIKFDLDHMYDFWTFTSFSRLKHLDQNVVETATVLMGSSLGELQSKLAQYDLKIQANLQRKKFIEGQLSGENEYKISESTVQVNPAALALQNHIQEQLTQLEMLEVKYTDEHPEIIRLKKLIEFDQGRISTMDKEIKASETTHSNPIYEQLLREKLMADINIETYRSSRETVLTLMKQKEEGIRKARGLELERKMLTLDHGIAYNTYSELRSQLENTRITRKLENLQKGIRFEILEPARIPGQPIPTNKPKIWFIGLMIGLGCGIALVVGLEVVDHSFRSLRDVNKFSDMPVLSVVPNFVTSEEMRLYRRNFKAAAALLIMLLTGVSVVVFIFRTPIIQVLQAL